MIFVLLSGILSLSLLFLDLLTKTLASLLLREGVPRPLIPHFLSLTYTKNDSIAFSPDLNSTMMALITVLTVAMIVLIAVLFFTYYKKNKAVRVCLAIVEAGAVGNLVDRLCLGYVRDFVDVSAFRPFAFLGSGFNFGVCNLADFYITFGAVALLFCILFVGKDALIPLGKNRKGKEDEDASL